MRLILWTLAGVVILALGVVGGIYLSGGQAALDQILAGDLPRHPAEAAPKPSAPAGISEDGEVLFYRDPMGLPEISTEPKKDSMGMDYIPIYENQGVGQGNILFYRDPMGLPEISTEPKRD